MCLLSCVFPPCTHHENQVFLSIPQTPLKTKSKLLWVKTQVTVCECARLHMFFFWRLASLSNVLCVSKEDSQEFFFLSELDILCVCVCAPVSVSVVPVVCRGQRRCVSYFLHNHVRIRKKKRMKSLLYQNVVAFSVVWCTNQHLLKRIKTVPFCMLAVSHFEISDEHPWKCKNQFPTCFHWHFSCTKSLENRTHNKVDFCRMITGAFGGRE